MSMKTAIVVTYRGAASILDSFLVYHLSLGFDHIFLFSDDPDDPGTTIAQRYPSVTVVPNDDGLRRQWRETPLYRSRAEWVETYIQKEVVVRQRLNVEVAIEMALEGSFDWLLHIDIDELFHCPGTTVAEHFQVLSEQGCVLIRYINHEAVPERVDVMDCFREVTLFKKNPRSLPGGEFAEKQGKVVKSIPNCPNSLFNFYSSGKSAARVVPGLRSCGVDSFSHPVQRQRVYRFQRWLAWKNPFRYVRGRNLAPSLQHLLLREGVTRMGRATDPVILHYPCCTFEVFWSKYRNRGNFDDRWFGTGPIRRWGLDSRDVVMKGDRQLAKAFYRERFILREPDVTRLMRNGLAVHIRGPSELLTGSSRVARPETKA